MILLLLLLLGCPSSPACDDVCAAARPAFEGCFAEWSVTYGPAVGYEDAADYDAWCATWVREQDLLADSAADPTAAHAALEDRCLSIMDTLEDTPCASYWSLWD